MARRRLRWTQVLLLSVAGWGACTPEIGAPPTNAGVDQNFGEKFFTIACQRVAYTSSLRARDMALQQNLDELPKVDVSGSRYRLACRFGAPALPDFAPQQDPKVATFVNERDPFVSAINIIFPPEELPSLQDFMIRLLPLTDNDIFPDLVRKAGSVLQELEGDAALHNGLARLDGRIGYRPRSVCLGLIREVVGYSELQSALSQLLQQIGEGGPANRAFLDLVEALGFELRGAQKVSDPSLPQPMMPSDSQRTLRLALDLLTQQNAAFGAEPKPVLLVRRDYRGLATVAKASGNQLPPPFVDTDGDGLADVDALGHFITAAGAAPAPFRLDANAPDTAAGRDADGRALDTRGKLVYEYLDLDKSLLAALVRDGAKLLDAGKDCALRVLLGASGLLGERRQTGKVSSTGEKLSFTGFNTVHAPLLDLLYGVFQVLRDPNVDGTLEAAKLLFRDHEPAVARVVGGALDAKELGKKHPEAKIDPASNLYDDLIPLLRQLVNTRKVGAKQSLLEDLIDALADRRTRNMQGMLQNYFSYRDVHTLDAGTQQVTNPGFHQLVDRSQPDSGANRSIQQRLSHIINNTNGMRMCNKENACFGVTLLGTNLCLAHFKECELFEIENGAVFYMQTIARLRDASGNLTTTPKANFQLKTENMPGWLASIVKIVGEDYLLKLSSGIDGFSTHPTTEAVNREMFLNPMPGSLSLLVDPARDIDGHDLRTYHANVLFAWEQTHPQYSCSNNDPCKFYDAFRPIVQAFADHDAEKLFLDLLSVLHKHWASRSSKTYQFTDPKAADFSWGSAIVTWEPLIIELLKKRELLDGLSDLAVAIKNTTLADGTPAKVALTKTAQFLLDPQKSSPNLTYRDGRNYSLTTDGKTKIPGGVSPFYILADAFAAKRSTIDALAGGPDHLLAEAWQQSTSNLVDIFLSVEWTGKEWRFANRRFSPVVQAVVDFLRKRLSSHRARGDTAHWLGDELPSDVERTLTGPVLARAADFLRVLDGQPAAKKAIYDLSLYLVDELASSSTFRAALTGIADLLQMLLDDDDLVAVARALGGALDPARGLVTAALRFVQPALRADAGDICDPSASRCGSGERCLLLGSGEHRCSREMLSRVLRNAYKEQSPGKSPVQTLLDLSTELHRLKPGSRTPYTGADFAEAFRQAREFLSDTETGLVKFFEIIKNRCEVPCPTGSNP